MRYPLSRMFTFSVFFFCCCCCRRCSRRDKSSITEAGDGEKTLGETNGVAIPTLKSSLQPHPKGAPTQTAPCAASPAIANIA